ncbi:hypothetical protein [Dyella sp. C9]|uniref:hypothetical protein n=1 Tax=Dyella sp. C9 TaxID=2202154 RepID=UPI000DEF98E1|nr:hypothetical protein [Dyella sp. C9]
MITLLALLLTLSGATLIYLASSRQQLRMQPLPAPARGAGWLAIAAGVLCWWHVAGAGAGISAALTALMLAWVCLPYLAWWRITSSESSTP